MRLISFLSFSNFLDDLSCNIFIHMFTCLLNMSESVMERGMGTCRISHYWCIFREPFHFWTLWWLGLYDLSLFLSIMFSFDQSFFIFHLSINFCFLLCSLFFFKFLSSILLCFFFKLLKFSFLFIFPLFCYLFLSDSLVFCVHETVFIRNMRCTTWHVMYLRSCLELII